MEIHLGQPPCCPGGGNCSQPGLWCPLPALRGSGGCRGRRHPAAGSDCLLSPQRCLGRGSGEKADTTLTSEGGRETREIGSCLTHHITGNLDISSLKASPFRRAIKNPDQISGKKSIHFVTFVCTLKYHKINLNVTNLFTQRVTEH